MSKIVKLFTDGGSRGNPGPAAIGMVIKDSDDKVLKQHAECIGTHTNNQAEYLALLAGLKMSKEIDATEVRCFLDSELVVKQMKREYKVKDKDLQPLFIKVWNLTLGFKKVTFQHIRRELNYEADGLLNQALDKHS